MAKIKRKIFFLSLLVACLALPFVSLAQEYSGAKSPELSDSVDVRFYGGTGAADYLACTNSLEENIYIGGKGKADFSSCPYDFMSPIYSGGKGNTAYTTCPFDLLSPVTFGGAGQSFYTTCPDNFMSLVTFGGAGQSFYTTCPDNFMSMVSKGGEGQSFYTTCPDNFMSMISKGGEGQSFYTTCPDNLMSLVSKGGIGQSFYTTCGDLTSLFVRKIADNDKWCNGKPNTFKIIVTNKDYAIYDLTNVSVRDSLGVGLSYSAWAATTGTYNPSQGVWEIPAINRGASDTLTLTAAPNVEGELTNYAWIKSASVNKAIAKDTAKVSVLSKKGVSTDFDFRLSVCPTISNDINLSTYIDTTFTSVKWSKISGADITEQGIINKSDFIAPRLYQYKAQITGQCNDGNIYAYLKVINNKYFHYAHEQVICYKKADEINLKRILGVEADGVWSVVTNGAAQYLTTSAGTLHAGAKIFNGEKAYTESNTIPTTPYASDNNAKSVVIKYTITDTNSCLKGQEYFIKLIFTNDIIL